ncbi:FCD domain-containing protein [Streptomyces sp. NPDC090052]|uniref:GntR family transcriptional regulator n=1 Tax=unclassified Streptomyces TaxID=2593676 RepID=UPI00225116ED|nr:MULTISPECIES: FCD domain-containing protein [unclassified Streptomyces]MCX4722932.1 FCD domain-containing protein [Streptomyces sp. NBC_01306]WSV07415.1 FCD domain-containing protein [Streptomyces sp. NBC_01020]WSX45535.1 FCD domain-containing protein [Streptomyces sp. NBC_00963]
MEQGRARDAVQPYAPPRPSGPARIPDPARSPERRETAEPAPGEHSRCEQPASAVRPVPDGPYAPASGAKQVRRHSVRGQILHALRTALVDGELVPGEVYSGPALGERFGVSATPVREAMQQLAVEGAVEVVPNRGFRVAERSARELAELAEVRALIEVPVMLRLARAVPADRWTELRPLAEATVSAAAVGDRARYAESDRAFHGAVLGLSGNQQLVAVADDLHRKAQWPLVSAPVTRRADLLADASEHTALLDALIARDLTVVQSLVREHFTGAPG